MNKKSSSDRRKDLCGSLKNYANPTRIKQENYAWQTVVEDSLDTNRIMGITTMSIAELLPSVTALSHADKFQLVQFMLAQLAQEDGVPLASSPAAPFDPRQFFGAAHESRQAVDDYLATLRDGWN